MDSLGKALAVVALASAIGGFIDFYIGRNGQKRVRDFLERLWIKVSDVSIRNFGKAEANLAVTAIDSMFGRAISLRRLFAMSVLFLLGCILCIAIPVLFGDDKIDFNTLQIAKSVAISSFVFSISISVTRFIAATASRVLNDNAILNIASFVCLVAIQYLIMYYMSLFSEIFEGYVDYLVSGMFEPATDPAAQDDIVVTAQSELDRLFKNMLVFQYVTNPWSVIEGAFTSDIGWLYGFPNTVKFSQILSVSINLGRLGFAFTFLALLLVRPAQVFIMTVWARVVESDKPVFTLLFGGISAFAKVVQELVKLAH